MRFFTMDYDTSCFYQKGHPVFEERVAEQPRKSIFEKDPAPLLYHSPVSGGDMPSCPVRLLVPTGGNRCTTYEVGKRIGVVFKEPTLDDPSLGVEV